MPQELAVKHFASHSLTIELGPSIIALGKPVRNIIIGAGIVYLVTSIFKSIAGIKKNNY